MGQIDNTVKEGIHVIVVGAGITGLLVAQGLKKAGVSCTVFEAEPAADYRRSKEWGMSIQWSLPLLSKLLPPELLDRVQSTGVDPSYEDPEEGHALLTYNAETGEIMKTMSMGHIIRVSRRKFRGLCAEGIDVQYNKKLVSADKNDDDNNEVVARFADQTTAKGHFLVAADGARSTVRTTVFPGDQGKADAAPFKAINMHVRYGDAETARFIRSKLSPILAVGIHPKGYWLWLSMMDVPDVDKPETWVFQVQWTWRDDDGGANAAADEIEMEKLKRRAEGFGEPFRTAWKMMPPETRPFENHISFWEPVFVPRESSLHGRVALIGDAAHPMSFHRGQGLNHGITDADKVVELLKEMAEGGKTAEQVASEYEKEMVARAGEEVRQGLMNTEMVHDWDRLVKSPYMVKGGAKND